MSVHYHLPPPEEWEAIKEMLLKHKPQMIKLYEEGERFACLVVREGGIAIGEIPIGAQMGMVEDPHTEVCVSMKPNFYNIALTWEDIENGMIFKDFY